ncbi:MAG: hypothetical protein LBC77_04000, partial [Spirochaetaceae bacterium]|nr:hypothetical protein [Spirochaetaceae bacterium]
MKESPRKELSYITGHILALSATAASFLLSAAQFVNGRSIPIYGSRFEVIGFMAVFYAVLFFIQILLIRNIDDT